MRLGAESGGIRTPGYVLAEMNTVNNFVATLIKDAADQSDKMADGERVAMAAFGKEWRDFFDEHKSGIGGWWARGTTPVYNKVQEYREMALRWRDKFVQAGGVPSSIDLPVEKRFSPWPYVIGIGMVAAAWMFFSGDRE